MQVFIKLFRLTAVFGLIAWGIFNLYSHKSAPLTSREGTSELITSTTAGITQYSLHVLFIGNSYTFFNDLPRQLVNIAASDPENHTQFYVQSVTRGGIGLKELWEAPEARTILASKKWDYVILQEQSFWAMSPDSVINTYKMMRMWDQLIKDNGARTLIFTTWPRKPGSHWYTDGNTSFLRDPDYMLKQFNSRTTEIAEKLGATAIGVADYWAYVNAAMPEIDLYTGDATHPSVAGTYLSALVFYRYLAQRSAIGVLYAPDNLSKETAEKLRAIVK